MAWCFVAEDTYIYILDLFLKKRSCCVVDVKEGPTKHLLRVKFIQGEDKHLDMRNFKAKTEFSEAFSSVIESRSAFVKKFVEKVNSLQMSESSSSNDMSSTPSDTALSASSMSELPPANGRSNVAKDKILGDCLKVHVSNLRAPTAERLIRPLDNQHVEKLRKGYLAGGMQFKVLATLFISGNIDNAMVPGGVVLEVIGGNHTRAALTSLFESGLGDAEVVTTVYRKDLSISEVLAVGVFHNQVDEEALMMTFLDKTRVLRNIKRRSKKWSAEARMVFGYKSNGETRRKLRTMSALADADEEVWCRVVQLIQDNKQPIRQTAFTKFVSLSKEEQLSLLTIWKKDGFRVYIKQLNNVVQDKTEIPEKTTESEVTEDSSEEDNGSNSRSSASLMKEIKVLKAENCKKKIIIQKVKEENMLLKTEKIEQSEMIQKLQSEVEKLRKMVNSGRNAEGNNCVAETRKDDTSKNSNSLKRQLDVNNDEDIEQSSDKRTKITYNIGEKVWAYYKLDDQAYPAKVISIKGNTYRVKYIEDHVVEDVSPDELWKFTSKKQK